MPNLQVVVTMPSTSGMDDDAVVNTFAVIADSAWTTAEIALGVDAFYNTISVGGRTIEHLLSGTLSRAADAVEVQIYDVTGKEQNVAYVDSKGRTRYKPPAHGSPVAATTRTLAPPYAGPINLPTEVALAVTLRGAGWQTALVEAADDADPGNALNRPRARLSARVFVGPLTTYGMETVGGRVRPSGDVQQIMASGAAGMNQALVPNGHNLAVWSRQGGFFTPVTHVQCDNAYDTQRRRGQAATNRLSTVA